jgi:hypothetical protein
MSRPPVLSIVVVFLGPVIAGAQTGPCRTTAPFSIAVGAGQHDRADASASPAQFEGRGVEAAIAGARKLRGFCIVGLADGGARSLHAVTGTFGRERLIDADAGFDVMRPVSSRIAGGIAVRASISATRHAFDDAAHSVAWFRYATLSAGPALRTATGVPGALLRVALSAPLAASIDHSYGAIWSGNRAPRLQTATWPRFRGIEARVSAERPIGSRTSATLTYDVRASRYDDTRPIRALSQRLMIGIAARGAGDR